MAFDLNKNDGSNREPSPNSPASSKFDLSKGVAADGIAERLPKSRLWIIGLAGVLIAGGGIWYYSGSGATNVSGTPVKEQTSVVVTHTTVVPVHAGHGAAENPSGENPSKVSAQVTGNSENAAAINLNNKIPATFGQGSSSFYRIDQSLVKRIVSYLAKHPGASLNIDGYASSDGSLAINQTLSQARADAFKKYLVLKNLAASRIVAVGRGIENPIASNDTESGRKKNRRVEVTLP